MKSVFFFLLLAAALCLGGKPDNALAPAAPAYDFSAVDRLMRDSVATIYKGNAVVLITVNGETVYSKSYGNLTPNTRRPIASNSKCLSGAVLMSLVDADKLALTDSIGKYLPNFTRYGKGGITIRQLLSHTSGFPGNSEQRYELIKYRNNSLGVHRRTSIAQAGAFAVYAGQHLRVTGALVCRWPDALPRWFR